MLLLIGASLLVTVLEQLRERRRPLAVLMAFGARHGVVARSVLWQTAIPVFLGLLLALVAGTGLGQLLLWLTGQPPWIEWTGVLTMPGIGARWSSSSPRSACPPCGA